MNTLNKQICEMYQESIETEVVFKRQKKNSEWSILGLK